MGDLRGMKTNFLNFFYMSIRNTKFCKVKMFRYGLPKDILTNGQKPQLGGGGVQRPPSLCILGLI